MYHQFSSTVFSTFSFALYRLKTPGWDRQVIPVPRVAVALAVAVAAVAAVASVDVGCQCCRWACGEAKDVRGCEQKSVFDS